MCIIKWYIAQIIFIIKDYSLRMDVKVLGVTCDGSSVNRRFFKLHETECSGITYKVPNPFAPEKRDLYFISDPPHLLKTVRNCWASKKRQMWVSVCILSTCMHEVTYTLLKCNGKVIIWEHLMEVYKNGTGADRATPGLSLVPKLKYEHLYLTSFSKMRVDLAAQVHACQCIINFIGNITAYI